MKCSSCSKCGFCSNHKQSVQTHVLSCCLAQKSYGCSECAYQNYVKEAVYRHIEEAHDTGEAVYMLKKLREQIRQYVVDPATDKPTLGQGRRRSHILSKRDLAGGTPSAKKQILTCKRCQYTSNIPTNVKIHVLGCVMEMNPFRCSLCPGDSWTRNGIATHIADIHDGENAQPVSVVTEMSEQVMQHIDVTEVSDS